MSTTEKFVVKVFGPNLNGAGQKKATFHVHEASCADCWRGVHVYGYDLNERPMEVETYREIVETIYPPSDFQYDMDVEDDRAPYIQDFWVAPCLRDLPDGTFGKTEDDGDSYTEGPAADDWEALAVAFGILNKMLQTQVDLVDPTGKPEWEQMIRDLNNIAERAETALLG